MSDEVQPSGKLSRRGFLIALTASAMAAACRPSDRAVPTIYRGYNASLPPPTHTPTRFVSGTPTPDAVFGAITFDTPILTPIEDLYITQWNYSLTPEIAAETYSLRVDGLVESPQTYTLADLRAMPAHEDTRVLECISNPVGGSLIGNLQWRGVLIQHILDQVKPLNNALWVRFEAADNYSTSVKREWITQPLTMLAYEMNGAPLTKEHGFPLRIHMPGLYGQKMPRWLTRIEFIDYDYIGYWEAGGWSNTAEMKTKSILRSPAEGKEITAGNQIALQGVAVGGKRKITRIELQIDEGDWLEAEMISGGGDLAWTQWFLEWTPPAPATYRIGVRATDASGFTQIVEGAGFFGGAFPDGTDAIHHISLRAV
ncbi:MAG: hypothetical protein OHK0023_00320 [Anaerolineae bacterium]